MTGHGYGVTPHSSQGSLELTAKGAAWRDTTGGAVPTYILQYDDGDTETGVLPKVRVRVRVRVSWP